MTGVASYRLSLFRAKYVVTDYGCWQWTAAKVSNGYGIFWNGKRNLLAHRWAFEQFVNTIPFGLELDHLCRNRGCVNPLHLEPVTHRENGRRGVAGMHRVATARLATHCKHGHALTDDNVRVGINPNNRTYRICKACKREQRRSYYAANRDSINSKKREARNYISLMIKRGDFT
jgi:HNH endonuclease